MRLVLILLTSGALFAQRQTFDVQTMLRLSRVSEPVLSPDGKWSPSPCRRSTSKKISSRNRSTSSRRRRCAGADHSRRHDNERPRWSPDSEMIYYVSNRDGSSQIWRMKSGGAPARSRISRPRPAAFSFRPTARRSCSCRASIPECGADDACNKDNSMTKQEQGESAHLHFPAVPALDRMARASAASIFCVDADGTDVKDLTPGTRDVPPFSLGGPDDYAISPDSTEVAFA